MDGPSSQRCRVMVVDDNLEAARTLSQLLTDAGFDVATMFDGQAALEAIEKFHPAVCLLDIDMPNMNGYELARRIRIAMRDNPPVMATMTASVGDQHLDQAVAAGFDLHFGKPAEIHDLIDQLKGCLKR
jgi:two-component system, OmpR family, response regulator